MCVFTVPLFVQNQTFAFHAEAADGGTQSSQSPSTTSSQRVEFRSLLRPLRSLICALCVKRNSIRLIAGDSCSVC